MSELTGPRELVLIGLNGKAKGQSASLRARAVRGIRARADVNNMADFMATIRNIPPNFLTDFLSAEEEEALLWDGGEEDDFILFSATSIFSRRTLARISEFFEETVPLYHGDVFRSHFRMTSSTFEMLAQLLAPSEHIPKGNAFGRRPIDPQKQIAVTVWALANQESCRQISDRFNITMSSVSRCIRRVAKALVDLRRDLVQWPRGNPF